MKRQPEAPKIPVLVDDPLAPDVFADEAVGFYLLGGNIRITLATWRIGHEQSANAASRVSTCRLVMPVSQAEAMVKGLGDFLAQMREASRDQNAPG